MKREDKKEATKTTIRLNIEMGYTFAGTTGIDIPLEILRGKSIDEKYQIAYKYATDHLSEIPVSIYAEYIPDSDTFDIDDIHFDENVEEV